MSTATLTHPATLLPTRALTASGRPVRAGGEKRGNNRDRAQSKVNILWRDGNGEYVMCAHGCGTVLTFDTMTRDRIFPGGSYRLDNLQAACLPCNQSRSDNPNWTYTR